MTDDPKTTQVLNLIGAAGLGALALLVTLYQPDVAWVVSQNMVDCGIRIAPGVTASISDATVIGHDIGVCIGDSGSAHIRKMYVDARPE